MARIVHRISTTSTILAAAAVVAAVCGPGVAAAHQVCLTHNGVYYDIHTNAATTTMDRYNTATSPPTLINQQGYSPLHMPNPPGSMWGDGVAFAATMQSRHAWLHMEPTQSAYWDYNSVTGESTWRFITNGGAEHVFRTNQCSGSGPAPPTTTLPPPTPAPNCLFAGGSGSGVHCSETETCCGTGTMNPQCIPQSSSDQCCTHFLAATRCNSSQTCCGMMGPGASSVARCCDAGSTCCQAQSSTSGTATCCPTGSTCCRGASVGICCGPNEECVPDQNSCRSLASSTPAASTSPAPVTTTPATTTPATTLAPGTHRVCLVYGWFFYDARTDATGTTLDRWNTFYNPWQFMDRNTFAPLNRPSSPSSNWGEGVAFAAAMQSRNVWFGSGPVTGAHWDSVQATGEDIWTFITANTVEDVMKTSQCRDPTVPLPPTTPAPPPFHCPATGGGGNLHCGGGASCCGAETSSPQCCHHSASCCQSTGYAEFHTCCAADTVCCQVYQNAPQCCTASEYCGAQGQGCLPLSTTIAPPPSTSPAPVTTTTGAPTSSPPPATTLPAGSHKVCFEGAPYYFEVVTNAQGTTYDRWYTSNPLTFMERNPYGPLLQPNPPSSMWGDGVAFAATMHARGVWASGGSPQQAFWARDTNSGVDTWTFIHANGFPDVVFRTTTCRNIAGPPGSTAAPTPAPTTTPPPTTAPTTTPPTTQAPTGSPTTMAPGTYRVCLLSNGMFYDIRSDASQTLMHRYNMATTPPTSMTLQPYGPVFPPNPPSSMWGDAVAFAATMQARHSWAYADPTQAAFWSHDGSTGETTWRFQVTQFVEYVFRTSQCAGSPAGA